MTKRKLKKRKVESAVENQNTKKTVNKQKE